MAMKKEQITELKSSLAVARKKDLAFGLCLGKSAETTVLIGHRTKSPQAVGLMAKKAGETSKLAFGTMKAAGKVLLLTCHEDTPPGLARKTKEMLKAAGLKMKVKILDIEGGVLDQDGEADEEEEAQNAANAPLAQEVSPEAAPEEPDPLEEKWRVTSERLAAALDKVAALGNVDISQARATFERASQLAESGDFEAGLKQSAGVAKLITDAVSASKPEDPNQKRWESASLKIEPLIKQTLASGGGDPRKIRALWSFAQAKAEADTPDFAAAVKTIGVLAKLIAEARTEGAKSTGDVPQPDVQPEMAGDTPGDTGTPPPPSGGGAATTTPSKSGEGSASAPATGDKSDTSEKPVEQTVGSEGDVEEAKPVDLAGDYGQKRKRADERLVVLAGLIKKYDGLIASNIVPTPTVWSSEVARIKGVIKGLATPPAKDDPKNLDAELTQIAKLEKTVSDMTLEKDKWKKALEVFELRMVPLDSHAQASADPAVKPKITKIRADLAAAHTKTLTFDFKGAIAALTPLMKQCDVVEALADGFAHYEAIRAQREGLVNPLVGTSSTVPDIDTLIKAIEALMTKAKEHAAADKYADAVKELDKIPPLDTKRARLVKDKVSYDAKLATFKGNITYYEGLPADVMTALAADLVDFKARVAAADYGITNDYILSLNKLKVLGGQNGYMVATIKAINAYLPVLAAFDAQLKIFKDHKGRAGIEGFYLGMQNDHDMAVAEAGLKKHSTATAILKRTGATVWAAQTAIADACLAYIDKRKIVDQALKDLRAKAGVAELLKKADALMAIAATQAVAKNFTDALANVQEAERRANEAKAADVAQEALAALKNGPALAGIATDFNAAFKVYADMRGHVVSKDVGAHLVSFIATSDAPAGLAQAEKAKDKPDFASAGTNLNAAVAILEQALDKILARAPFATQLAKVKALIAELTVLNLNNCITTRLDQVKALATEAENLGKAPSFDFAAGDTKLAHAMGIAQGAKADGKLWPELKTARLAADAVTASITAEPTVATLMAKRTAQLAKLKADGATRQAANDFKSALRLAKQAAALGTATTADVAMCKNIEAKKGPWLTARLPQITGPGKEAAADDLIEATARMADIEKMKTAGNFDGAWSLMNAAYFSISRGIAAVAAKTSYDAVQTATAAKLKAVADKRNAGVETELVAIEKRYAAAQASATSGLYPGAEAEMTTLGPLCDALLIKATAWEGYDAARKDARAKLDTALAHDKKAAIQSVLASLSNRFKVCVETSKTDISGAKAEMVLINAGCNAALKTANASADFATAADALSGGDADTAPSAGDLKSAGEMLTALKAIAEAGAAKDDIKQATGFLALASNADTPAKDARIALNKMMTACTAAQVKISAATQLVAVANTVRALIGTLRSHVQKDYISGDCDILEKGVSDAENAVLAGGAVAQGTAIMNAAVQDCADTLVIADAQVKYLATRAEEGVEPRLKQLEEHKHRYAIKPSIDTIRTKLAAAADKSAEHDPVAALVLLEDVRKIGTSAFVLAQMRANTPPDVKDVKAILARSGGQDELDAMLDQLEPDAQTAVLRVAFEARFGCTLKAFSAAAQTVGDTVIDANLSGPNLRKFYEDMAELPLPDTLGNDSMKIFTILQDSADGGSLYRSTKKEVVMKEGDAAFSGAYSFGQPSQVGPVEPGCEPANDDPVSFFSWNTLHEVGHAVDDKHGFMKKNGSGAAYGGWQVHGGNVATVAEKLAGKYKYDEGYVGQILSGKAAPALPMVPDTGPLACTPEEWEARRIAACAHITSALVGSKPWSSHGIAVRLDIGGRVYQQSYANNWYSYDFGARSQGITHYQFRAPGEWFAELYAAYYSGKLKKDSHPAVKWLKKLNPENA